MARANKYQTTVRRLLRLVHAMVRKLELEMKEGKMSELGEKEASILYRLTTTMGRLIDLEASAGKSTEAAETREMQDIRNKLLQRIDELKRV